MWCGKIDLYYVKTSDEILRQNFFLVTQTKQNKKTFTLGWFNLSEIVLGSERPLSLKVKIILIQVINGMRFEYIGFSLSLIKNSNHMISSTILRSEKKDILNFILSFFVWETILE